MGLLYLYKNKVSGESGMYEVATNACRGLVGRTEGRSLGRPRCKWESCFKENPKLIGTVD
jgi:hypothetical protein